MKLICNKSLLLEIINTVQKAVSSKSVMPILECIKLDADMNFDGKFDASDLPLYIKRLLNVHA